MSFTSASRRDLKIAVCARAVSLLGDEVAMIALALRLQGSGAGPGAVAGLLMANLVPILLLSGPVGRLVDRRDNRTLLLVSSAAQALACVALSFLSATPGVLALVMLLGVGQAVNGATWQALIPALVPPADLVRALSRSQAASRVAGVFAPALGGVLSGSLGTQVPLLVDAATFVVVGLAARLLATTRAIAAPRKRERGGWSIVAASPLLRTTLGQLALFGVLAGAVNVVEVFLIRSTLHASATWFGFANAAYGVGLLCGSLLAGRFGAALIVQARGFVWSAAALSASLAGYGLAPAVGWLLPLGLIAGSANGVLNVCTNVLTLGNVAPAERGRVAAVQSGIGSGTQLAAYAGGGALASVISPRAIYIWGGLLGLVAPALFGRALLRQAAAAARRADDPSKPCTAGVERQALFSRRSRLAGSRGTRVG